MNSQVIRLNFSMSIYWLIGCAPAVYKRGLGGGGGAPL